MSDAADRRSGQNEPAGSGPEQEERYLHIPSALAGADFVLRLLSGRATLRDLHSPPGIVLMALLDEELKSLDAKGIRKPVNYYKASQCVDDATPAKTLQPIEPTSGRRPVAEQKSTPDAANQAPAAAPAFSKGSTGAPSGELGQQAQRPVPRSGCDVNALAASKDAMAVLPTEQGRSAAPAQRDMSLHARWPQGVSAQEYARKYSPPPAHGTSAAAWTQGTGKAGVLPVQNPAAAHQTVSGRQGAPQGNRDPKRPEPQPQISNKAVDTGVARSAPQELTIPKFAQQGGAPDTAKGAGSSLSKTALRKILLDKPDLAQGSGKPRTSIRSASAASSASGTEVQDKTPADAGLLAESGAGAASASVSDAGTASPSPPAPLADDTVTAHAAAQWRFLGCPTDEPEPYPEVHTRHKAFAACTVDAARVRGKKHKHEGTNSDDWFKISDVDGITILAVSDGAGSRKLSRIGASTACEASVTYIHRELQRLKSDPAAWAALYAQITAEEGSAEMQKGIAQMGGIINRAVLAAITQVHRAHEQRQNEGEFEELLGRKPEFQDFAATLLLAIIIPLKGREKFIVTCQVGDGMITALDLKGPFNPRTTARLLGRPDSGEYSGQTEFITSKTAADEKQLQKRTMICRRSVDLILAMTDGVADDYYPNQTQMPRLYYDLLANGILEEPVEAAAGLPEDIQLPEPATYPWVNNPAKKVSLQYASRLLEESGKSIADVWNERAVIFREASKTLPKPLGSSVTDRLARWLDNYVQRGSFDDRTLVIARLKEADA